MEVQKDLTFETCFEGNDTPLENLYDSDPSNELKEILNLDQRITNNDSHNATQFQRAIESGRIDAALLVSATENNFDLVKQLVQHGANVNHIDSQNSSPLRAAFIIYYVITYRKILIKYNAYISQP